MAPSIVHDLVLPLDQFAALVQQAGLHRIAASAAAVDAFGVMRLRTLTERLGLTVAGIHSDADPARAALLSGLLQCEPAPSRAAAEISAATLGAHGGRLADAVAAVPSDATEVRLDAAAWRRLAAIS